MWGEKGRGERQPLAISPAFSSFPSLYHISHFSLALSHFMPPPPPLSLIYTPSPLSAFPSLPLYRRLLLSLSLPFTPRRRTTKAKARRRWERFCSFHFSRFCKTKGRQKFQEIRSNKADRGIEKDTSTCISLPSEWVHFSHTLFYKQLVSDCDQALGVKLESTILTKAKVTPLFRETWFDILPIVRYKSWW